MLLRQHLALLADYCKFVKKDLFEKSRAPLVGTTSLLLSSMSMSCGRLAFGRCDCEIGPSGCFIVCLPSLARLNLCSVASRSTAVPCTKFDFDND